MEQSTQCKIDGNFTGRCLNADVIEHRFKPEGYFEVRIEFATKDNQTGKTFLDLSDDYSKQKNNENKKQFQITCDILQHFNIDIHQDSTQIKKLVGQELSLFGKTNDKGGYVVYLNTNKPEVVANAKKIKTALSALFADSPPPAISTPPAIAAPAANPLLEAGEQEDDDPFK